MNPPFQLDPPLFLGLLDDMLLQRLSAYSLYGTLSVVVQDGRYLVITSDVFLRWIPD
jgi:hypothetical protein